MATRRMYHRNITVDDDRWKKAQRVSEQRGMSVSALFREFIDQLDEVENDETGS